MLYLDFDKSIEAEIKILFGGVSKTNLNNLFDENILDDLVIIKNELDLSYNIELQGCYGISGQFNCECIEVKEVIERDFQQEQG